MEKQPTPPSPRLDPVTGQLGGDDSRVIKYQAVSRGKNFVEIPYVRVLQLACFPIDYQQARIRTLAQRFLGNPFSRQIVIVTI
jgi:hypothetical protein